jgi:hypothetical protein
MFKYSKKPIFQRPGFWGRKYKNLFEIFKNINYFFSTLDLQYFLTLLRRILYLIEIDSLHKLNFNGNMCKNELKPIISDN